MDKLKIIQHNVLSWTFTRRNELCNYYFSEDPDIILLNSIGKNSVKIHGYCSYLKNTPNEDHAGIAIAVKRNIPAQLLDDFSEDVLAIQIQTTRGHIIVATTYVPPRRPVLPEEDILKIMRKNIPCYILADFNATHAALGHPSTNALGRRISRLIDNDLVSFLGPEFPTRFSVNSTGKPDILLANRHHHWNYSLHRGDLTSSDHWPVILTLSSKPIVIPTPQYIKYQAADWDSFRTRLISKMDQLEESTQALPANKTKVDTKIERWAEAIQAETAHFPKKSSKTLPHPRDSEELKMLKRRYDVLQQIAQNHGYTPNLLQDLKALQQAITNESVKIYNSSWEKSIKEIESDHKDPAKFWKGIRRLMGRVTEETPYILKNGDKLFAKEEQEQAFRETWKTVFSITPEENANFDAQKEAEVLQTINNNQESFLPFDQIDLSRLNPLCGFTSPTSVGEIKEIIAGFKNKAPGLSKINKTIVKELPNEAIHFYANALNESFSLGYFPRFFKLALLKFIGKQGKALTNVSNYRPISLLEVAGKIFEKIILKRLNRFLIENNLLNPNQYGFRRARGTQVALAKLYETIAIAQTKGHGCNLISRDISKAFDKVWHEGLKYKLWLVQPPEILLRTLCSFLDDRRACILIGTYKGPEFELESGVPQGSILSPALFNFYTFDLPPPSQGCHQVIFADDHTQVVTHPSKRKNILALKTAREIEKVNNYERCWKISTSLEKFQLLSISAAKPADVIVEGQLIPFNANAKVLGFTISKYGFVPHIENRIRLAKSTLTKLKRFKGASTDTLLHLFKMLVRPRLEYPAMLMCNASKSNLGRLQAIQNLMLRRAFHQVPPYFNTVEELHQQGNLEPINTRLHRLGNKTWSRLHATDRQITTESLEIDVRELKDHNWWRRLAPLLSGDPPVPVFTAT